MILSVVYAFKNCFFKVAKIAQPNKVESRQKRQEMRRESVTCSLYHLIENDGSFMDRERVSGVLKSVYFYVLGMFLS